MSATIPTGTKVIALGPELVDQSLWFTHDYWTYHNGGTSFDGIKITYPGGYDFIVYKNAFWIPSKTYRITITVTGTGGLTGPYGGVSGTTVYAPGTTTYDQIPSGAGVMYIYGSYFIGEITYLSIREVLS